MCISVTRPDLLRKLYNDVELPQYQTRYSAGADIRAYLPDVGSVYIAPGRYALISTGLALNMTQIKEIKPVLSPVSDLNRSATVNFTSYDQLYEVQIRSRSGLALKRGLVVAQGVGTIDMDYTGEIKVILHNISGGEQYVEHGERIAQLVLLPIMHMNLEVISKDRGDGGFGSTGGN